MAANDNYHPGGRYSVKKGGKLDVDALTLLTSSVQALTSKFDRLQAGSSSSSPKTYQMCNVHECSAILQNTLPKKLGDPSSYSILVKLGDIENNKALCDLGASVSLMSLSICKKLQMGELKPTRISLQLVDRSVKFPLGVFEDVPLRVGKFFIPCEFVVMEMEEDSHVPIILGRPFLATAGAIINMKNGKITFEVGDEKMEYSLLNAMGTPSI
ncbi:uncharacterized protein LOC110683120 [Chenopodium quinoa]|uniref:uncharacterized protein LOC110683120 n=1 Tax=Chenopodium quinoa TaxID=63459 RepID=UPI000B780002|nr:uncharacterized protein LOC110683120 [Chenopodium quinoa]